MSKALVRPPFILAHPGDQSGCGYYRIVKPIEALVKNGYATARTELGFVPDHILPHLDPDIVVWQRQNETGQIEAMRHYRAQLPDSFFVYEIDDALSSVPDSSYHQPFMSPTVDDRIPLAASHCDAITVTTEGLKEHMERLCPGKPVRIAPNMLSRDDLAKADKVRANLAPRGDNRFRVGWGGGIGHTGDLALIIPVMEELKDEVHWVFIGYKPENIPVGVSYEYRDAVQPDRYIEALAGLDVDVIVAPLEENHFNFCKSNLRLIESGACQFPVIATPFGPYLTKRPPVAYATMPEEWAPQIRRCAALTPAGRKVHADALRAWVERNYLFESNLQDRAAAWMPDDAKPFVPVRAAGRGVEIATTQKQLLDACRDSAFDVVYVRDGVKAEIPYLQQIGKHLTAADVATLSVVSNDGGPAGFPAANNFATVPDYVGETLADIAAEIGGTAPIAVASGPVIVLSRFALNTIGQPDFARWSHPEAAIFEWSVAATHLGFRNLVDTGSFVRVEAPVSASSDHIQALSFRCSARWPLKQVEQNSILKHRELLELRFHRSKFRQMQPQDPTDYILWSKRCDTMGAQTMEACLAWYETTSKPAIDVVYYGDKPLTKAELGDLSPGRWKLFFPQGTLPAQTSMAHAVQAIEENPAASMFYGDHDYAVNGNRSHHDFKPNFDLHLLLSRDYVSQAMVVRTESLGLIAEGLDGALPAACQLYALALDLAAIDLQTEVGLVVHVPRIMAHLQPPNIETLARYANRNAETANRVARDRAWPIQVQPHKDLRVYQDVSYILPEHTKRVTIIIPTKNNLEMIVPCLATLLKTTSYPRFKVVVVDNGSTDESVLDYYAGITDIRVDIIRHEAKFNWSEINNWATQQPQCCMTDVFVFLNDDTRVLEPHWLHEMVGAAYFPKVGAVGARLSFPHNVMQHVGIVSAGGNSGHIHLGLPIHIAGYNSLAALSHEATAVTGACMAVRADAFQFMGGFDEALAGNFNDVAFCLELRKRGLVNVVPARTHLQHIASGTRRHIQDPAVDAQALAEIAYMRERYAVPDPYWNPNLMFGVNPTGTLAFGTDMNILNWPPLPNPWEAEEYQRVMVFGNINIAASEVQDKSAVYQVLLQGNAAQIVDPPLPNVQPFDLRDPETALAVINELGIQKIIIGTLEYGSTLLLSFASRLGLPVEYRPRSAEAACPMRVLATASGPCDKGWTVPGQCQACVDVNGSPNGYVSIDSWRSEWRRFIERTNVTTQLEFLEKPAYADALGYIYGANTLEDIPTA